MKPIARCCTFRSVSAVVALAVPILETNEDKRPAALMDSALDDAEEANVAAKAALVTGPEKATQAKPLPAVLAQEAQTTAGSGFAWVARQNHYLLYLHKKHKLLQGC